MDGFINFLKPPGMTSHDAVGYVRRQLGEKKVGHAGTLDPGAAGVLPVAIGRATRLIEYLDSVEKAYRAELVFGFSTDSGDDSGSVVERAEAEGAYVVCLTPLPLRTVTYYRFDGSADVRCYNIDATVMKTMLRAKNGLVVLDDGVIEAKYNCRNIKPYED